MLKNILKSSLHFYFSLGIIVISMVFFISFGASVNLMKTKASSINSNAVASFVFQKKTNLPIALSNQKHNNKKSNSRNKSRDNSFFKKKNIKIKPAGLFTGLLVLAKQSNRTLSETTYYSFNFISSVFRPPHF